MGNWTSDEIRFAVEQDGQQNVKRTAILTANKIYFENFIEQVKPSFQTEISKKQLLKESHINETRNTLTQMYQNQKIALETQETGTLQHLQSKHSQSFRALSGYDEALHKLQEFQKRSNQLYLSQKNKIIEDINQYNQQIKWEIQKVKNPLPALMGLGISQKDQILKELALQHPQQVDQQNRKLKDHFYQQFDFEEIHRKTCDEWIPNMQLDEIVENFKKSLEKLGHKKSKNTYFGCF